MAPHPLEPLGHGYGIGLSKDGAHRGGHFGIAQTNVIPPRQRLQPGISGTSAPDRRAPVVSAQLDDNESRAGEAAPTTGFTGVPSSVMSLTR